MPRILRTVALISSNSGRTSSTSLEKRSNSSTSSREALIFSLISFCCVMRRPGVEPPWSWSCPSCASTSGSSAASAGCFTSTFLALLIFISPSLFLSLSLVRYRVWGVGWCV
jgi:hypothetical protein